METVVRIGTHDGVFHADDVFAVAALQSVYQNAIVARSRDPEVLDKCHILVDVGGEYNGETKFDHHQQGRAGERPNGVLYSSFGLVWKRYGEHICGNAEIADIIDRRLVQHVDMIDNGQHMFPSAVSPYSGAQQFNISTFVSLMNPRWDELSNGDTDEDVQFYSAVSIAGSILLRLIAQVRSEMKARNEVRDACLAASEGGIILMNRSVPWAQAVHDFASKNAKYVVFPDTRGSWMVQAIPVAPGSFKSRKPLPAEWGGLRDKAFAEKTGVSEGIFCHPNLFICGAKSLSAAMTLASMALTA